MPDIHYFHIDDLRLAVTEQRVIEFADDKGDGTAIDGVLDWVRQKGEEYTKSRLAAAGYDTDAWDVDADLDELSDNVPDIVSLIALRTSIYQLGLRRDEMPQNFREGNDWAEFKLGLIDAGTLTLVNETSSNESRTISNNMEESDLGELTQKGGTEELPWAGYQ